MDRLTQAEKIQLRWIKQGRRCQHEPSKLCMAIYKDSSCRECIDKEIATIHGDTSEGGRA